MKRYNYFLLLMCILILSQTSGCADIQADLANRENTVISISGRVNNAHRWTQEELASMDSVEQEFINQEGVAKVYTGVPLTALLAECDIQEDAETLQFVTNDGSSRRVAVSDIESCENCLVTFEHEGKKPGLTILLPDIEGLSRLVGIEMILVK